MPDPNGVSMRPPPTRGAGTCGSALAARESRMALLGYDAMNDLVGEALADLLGAIRASSASEAAKRCRSRSARSLRRLRSEISVLDESRSDWRCWISERRRDCEEGGPSQPRPRGAGPSAGRRTTLSSASSRTFFSLASSSRRRSGVVSRGACLAKAARRSASSWCWYCERGAETGQRLPSRQERQRRGEKEVDARPRPRE